ncbi:MAG: tetratricopeptide repeat protein, partial [Acidobacteriota bacterium]
MSQAKKKIVLVVGAVTVAVLLPFFLLQRRSSAHPGNGLKAAQVKASPVAATLQTYRNLGKAYYEQGKYSLAVGQFQKVVKSGHAIATDYMDLGMAFVQSNMLDKALAALTTAQQMAPHLVAIDYNLGILYKRQLRYALAEAQFKKVLAADAEDPATWFNLGTVYFAEHKLDLALESYEHLNRMGFNRGQNFYVASLFRTFTTLVRLGRRDDAEKILKIHQEYADRLPSVSLQNAALAKGKYGVILVPLPPPVQVGQGAAARPVAFRPISAELGISLPAVAGSAEADSSVEIKSASYSLDFARKHLVPLFGSSITTGNY